MFTQMLSQMMEACKTTGPVQRRRLKHGLHITLVLRSTTWTLILRRDDVYPSEQEWDTVLRHWPYRVEHVTAERRFVQQVYTLRGEVPKQKAK